MEAMSGDGGGGDVEGVTEEVRTIDTKEKEKGGGTSEGGEGDEGEIEDSPIDDNEGVRKREGREGRLREGTISTGDRKERAREMG
jgi:hypothetical protein